MSCGVRLHHGPDGFAVLIPGGRPRRGASQAIRCFDAAIAADYRGDDQYPRSHAIYLARAAEAHLMLHDLDAALFPQVIAVGITTARRRPVSAAARPDAMLNGMRAHPVDPRDIQWEEDITTYRVYFWQQGTTGGWISDEWEIEDADISQVLNWATDKANDRSFVLYAKTGNDESPGLLTLFGTDPTRRPHQPPHRHNQGDGPPTKHGNATAS
jgi:hypothetical protein